MIKLSVFIYFIVSVYLTYKLIQTEKPKEFSFKINYRYIIYFLLSPFVMIFALLSDAFSHISDFLYNLINKER